LTAVVFLSGTCFDAFAQPAGGKSTPDNRFPRAEDWPMWRHDARRTAVSRQKLPDKLHLQWMRRYPRVRPAFGSRRLQFDAGYEPVVMGKTLFMGSPCNDSVSAIDTETGAVKWTFYTDGPVRFAPVAWRNRVFAASDDGCLYCLDAAAGKLLWKFRAVPSMRKMIGNGRLISAWPIRGGPVLEDGRIYFAAGIWPFEGIFVYALDAGTGKVLWLNDRSGSLFLGHPHGAWSFGGPSLQGYLLVSGKDLLVPNGTGGVPAFFDIKTGELQAFSHLANRIPGSWFVAGDPNGQLGVDPEYNRELHEDTFYETKWSTRGAWVHSQLRDPWLGRKWLLRPGSRHSISVDGKTFPFAAGFEGVRGSVCSMLAADAKVFVVTDEGGLYCFGARATTPKKYEPRPQPLAAARDSWSHKVERILRTTGKQSGYTLVWGVGTGRLIEELALQSSMHIIAVDPDSGKVNAIRIRLDAAGLYGERVAVHAAQPAQFECPPYLADLVVSEDFSAAGLSEGTKFVERAFALLRPYGGVACLSIPNDRAADFAASVRKAGLANAKTGRAGDLTLLSRNGALPGTSNYTGQWSSPDERVKAPLGVLWYNDSVRQFKRSPQPKIIDGVMISQPKAWLTTERPYSLEEPTFADVYTGRVLSKEEALAALGTLPEKDGGPQPAHYGPSRVDKDKVWGKRFNPVTGLKEPRVFPKSHGCEPGMDYGHMITIRSGTGAFYDKRFESGLVNISGIRTGCTNSIIPANGILNIPYFYEGCTCGYPLASGLGMVHMPEDFEQWMAWGDTPLAGRIRRLGINFGAPGDRMTESGILWLDYPSVGGPSPEVGLDVTPARPAYYYHHSLWVEGGNGPSWVVASGVEGVERITIELLPAGARVSDANAMLPHTVRLYFAEPGDAKPDERVFSIRLQGKKVMQDLDIVKDAGGRMRGIVREFRGIKAGRTLELMLTARSGLPILSGMELRLETP